jgi:hypothetical protein
VGVEGLTVRFPETSYPGHFKEQGYNAIEFKGMFHSWVRDVHVVNGDYGVSISYSHFVTVEDAVIDSNNGRSGHHALNCGHGGDNLFVGFDVRIPFVHDLTVEWSTTGNVFAEGKGKNLSLDHHRAAPYSTLFTELHVGTGSNVWKSGGSGNRGPHTAAYSTFWNVRAAAELPLPPDDYGPRMTFVGFASAESSVSSSLDWWLEDIAPDDVHPQNLWRAMREQRLGSVPWPQADAGASVPEGDGGASDPSGPGLPEGEGGAGGGPDDDADLTGDVVSEEAERVPDVRASCTLGMATAPVRAGGHALLALCALLCARRRAGAGRR